MNTATTQHLRPTHDAATDERIAEFTRKTQRQIERANARIIAKLAAMGLTLDSAPVRGQRAAALALQYIADPAACAASMARTYGHHFRTLVPVNDL